MNMRNSRSVLFAALAIVMAITRFSPATAVIHLQDASWAVFFLAGFYLVNQWRWAFPALMVEAVLIDYVAIEYLGVSNYCVTAAYWFLVPSYAALWAGGSWLHRHHSMDFRGFSRLVASASGGISLCFLISNASFYWIGSRVAVPTWDGWLANFSDWYWPFLRAPLAYVGAGAMMHVIVIQGRKLLEHDSVQQN